MKLLERAPTSERTQAAIDDLKTKWAATVVTFETKRAKLHGDQRDCADQRARGERLLDSAASVEEMSMGLRITKECDDLAGVLEQKQQNLLVERQAAEVTYRAKLKVAYEARQMVAAQTFVTAWDPVCKGEAKALLAVEQDARNDQVPLSPMLHPLFQNKSSELGGLAEDSREVYCRALGITRNGHNGA
jgi:hypothetical protein